MKIASIFAAMPGNHSGLLEIKKIVSETLTELGVAPEEVNLGYRSLPYYDGIKSEYMNTLSELIGASDGIIIFAGASFGLPGALISTLIEHFAFGNYKELIRDKNCLVIMNCDDGSGSIAMSAMDLAVQSMGALCAGRLVVDSNFVLSDESENSERHRLMIERLCEDYYRVLRQQRVTYRPMQAVLNNPFVQAKPEKKAVAPDVSKIRLMPGLENLASENNNIPPVESFNFDSFTREQQKDIDEISRFFKNKLNEKAVERGGQADFIQQPITPVAVNTSSPTLAQRTASLTHYYRAERSDGLKANVFLNISGGEGFEGSLIIDGADCDFKPGPLDNADVTIITEDSKWAEIIKGKISAQKAFMIGQIKVRGNFVLLSKFDQLFDFEKNIF